MNKTALVTGGAGFIGSHLCEELIFRGFKVLCVDNLFRGSLKNLKNIKENLKFSFYNIDLLNSNSIIEIQNIIELEKPSLIFHYAAINGTEYFYDIPYKVTSTNSIATYYLLESLKNTFKKVADYKPKLIFASSSEVYGSAKVIPTTEDSLTYLRLDEDRDSYAAGKLISEFYIKHFSKQNELDYFIFRIFNVYGPRMINTKYGQVIPELILKAKNSMKNLEIIGSGEETRSFCFIEDHINLSLEIIDKAKSSEVYNVGNPQEIKIAELSKKIVKNLNKDLFIIPSNPRSGDHQRRAPSIEKAKKYIGEFEFISLEKGLNEMIESYRKN